MVKKKYFTGNSLKSIYKRFPGVLSEKIKIWISTLIFFVRGDKKKYLPLWSKKKYFTGNSLKSIYKCFPGDLSEKIKNKKFESQPSFFS